MSPPVLRIGAAVRCAIRADQVRGSLFTPSAVATIVRNTPTATAQRCYAAQSSSRAKRMSKRGSAKKPSRKKEGNQSANRSETANPNARPSKSSSGRYVDNARPALNVTSVDANSKSTGARGPEPENASQNRRSGGHHNSEALQKSQPRRPSRNPSGTEKLSSSHQNSDGAEWLKTYTKARNIANEAIKKARNAMSTKDNAAQEDAFGAPFPGDAESSNAVHTAGEGFGGNSSSSSLRMADQKAREDSNFSRPRPSVRARTVSNRPAPHQLSPWQRSRQEGQMRLFTGHEAQQFRKVTPDSYRTQADWTKFDGKDKLAGGPHVRLGGILTPEDVPYQPLAPLREMKVAKLEHGLDRVLFNPGVHRLKDPRSGIYNYSSYLRKIPDVDSFDYQALTPYVTSSQDDELIRVAQREQARFCGSTSSLTAMISQVYFLLSGWKKPETDDFSSEFMDSPRGFSHSAKLPAAIALSPRQSPSMPAGTPPVYAIDQDKEAAGEDPNSNYVLTSLGKSMEKLLTATPENYASYLRVNRGALSGPQSTNADGSTVESEAYHYAKTGKAFVMRSQLDCIDERLPRKTFDLKSRAVVSVRFDRANWVQAGGYQISELTGLWGSFERERYDMARSAWLKYYLQAKIGNMDGIFVAYHNAAQCFGFEYFPLEDLARRIFGSVAMADQAFHLSVGLSERILERAVDLYPGKPLRLTLETPEEPSAHEDSNFGDKGIDTMRVWVQPRLSNGKIDEQEVTQLDVTVDRYLRKSLAKGPIDFRQMQRADDEAFPKVDEGDVMAERLLNENSQGKVRSAAHRPDRPIDWSIEWMIDHRPDLQRETILQGLEAANARLRSLSGLVLPEIDFVNQREVRLQEELSQNPAALLKYKQDKASGIAAGMPRAPGQVDLFALDDGEISVDAPLSEADVDVEDVASGGKGDGAEESVGTTQWQKPNASIKAMRARSRRGAQQLLEDEEGGPFVEFVSTSESSHAGQLDPQRR